MITLDRLEQKLDVLLRRTEAIETVQDAIRFEVEQDRKELAESQGKLLAALNEVQGLLLASDGLFSYRQRMERNLAEKATQQQVVDLGWQVEEARKQILLLVGICTPPRRAAKKARR